jgi:uncharacterized peroxidase-related enzyme
VFPDLTPTTAALAPALTSPSESAPPPLTFVSALVANVAVNPSSAFTVTLDELTALTVPRIVSSVTGFPSFPLTTHSPCIPRPISARLARLALGCSELGAAELLGAADALGAGALSLDVAAATPAVPSTPAATTPAAPSAIFLVRIICLALPCSSDTATLPTPHCRSPSFLFEPCKASADRPAGRVCEARRMRAVSRFGVPALDELPEDVRGRIEAVGERTGFVPNVFLALARRPAEFRAFVAYHDALMDKETPGLSKADREMIVVATSAANDCTYCVVAHGAILRIRAKDPLLADQVAVNYRQADITPRQRAMLDFALRVATESATVEDEHLAELAHHGFDTDDAWDIGAIAALFAQSNRMAHLMALRPNPEFHLLGRVPRD